VSEGCFIPNASRTKTGADPLAEHRLVSGGYFIPTASRTSNPTHALPQDRMYRRRDPNWLDWSRCQEVRMDAIAKYESAKGGLVKKMPLLRDACVLCAFTCLPPDRVRRRSSRRTRHTLRWPPPTRATPCYTLGRSHPFAALRTHPPVDCRRGRRPARARGVVHRPDGPFGSPQDIAFLRVRRMHVATVSQLTHPPSHTHTTHTA
jgi:hypothetical protein